MIIKQDHSNIQKRWVYKLDALGLEKLKVSSENDSQEIVPVIQPPKLIISEESEDKTRKYSTFNGYPELYRYIAYCRSVHGHPPSLYEVCPYYMKMHFDIDLCVEGIEKSVIDNKEISILYPILVAYKDVLNSLYDNLFTDKHFVDTLVITQSHTTDKISYHIIQDCYFMTNQECKEIYNQTKSLLHKRNYTLQGNCIDASVYKPNQNFRIYGCCKKNKKNLKSGYVGPKLMFGDFGYTHDHLICRLKTKYEHEECITPINLKVLAASLLSNIVTCTRLTLDSPNSSVPFSDKAILKSSTRKIDHEDNMACEMFFKTPNSRTSDGEIAFSPSGAITGRIVTLSRIKPSHCSLCDRVHDEENIFLRTEMNNDVFYYCRRALDDKKKVTCLYIGNITSLE